MAYYTNIELEATIISPRVKKVEDPLFFGRLKQLLPKANKIQLAEILDVKPSAITPYVKGRIPGLQTLIRISNFTGASIHWLVTGKGPVLLPENGNEVSDLVSIRKHAVLDYLKNQLVELSNESADEMSERRSNGRSRSGES